VSVAKSKRVHSSSVLYSVVATLVFNTNFFTIEICVIIEAYQFRLKAVIKKTKKLCENILLEIE
jgi:hypothetical protein